MRKFFLFFIFLSIFVSCEENSVEKPKINLCENINCDEWKKCNTNNGMCELKEGRCLTNDDCDNNKICNESHNCIEEIIDLCENTNCDEWKTCNTNNGMCELTIGRCLTNDDCDNNKICNENHNCVEEIIDLCENINCDEWKTCNSDNGMCELKEGRCLTNDDCDNNKICNEVHNCVEEIKFIRYPNERAISPINEYVVLQMKKIIQNNPTTNEKVFMKVGASGTVSKNLLYCLGDINQSVYQLDLDIYSNLNNTIEYFREITFNNESSFNRVTTAAESGRTALWVMTGNPSPFDEEVSIINPRYAIINYGTNDMGMGSTYKSALFPFVQNFENLIKHSISLGIVPLITGLNPRNDNEDARKWAAVYNDVTRAIAEKYQVPYIDLYYLSNSLDNYGLLSDGIHGNVYKENSKSEPCIFNSNGLEFNYNKRNLYSLQLLEYIKNTLILNDLPPDNYNDGYLGNGTEEQPFVIDIIPFSHNANTLNSNNIISSYHSCDTGQNESGGEYYYKLEISSTVKLRIMIFDNEETDIDIHLLENEISQNSCTERNDKIIEKTFNPGTYYLTADTFVSNNIAKSGEYMIVINECDASDCN